MRYFFVLSLLACVLSAQGQAPAAGSASAAPAGGAVAQAPAAIAAPQPEKAVAAETVVATIGGQKLTAGELQRLVSALPQQAQQSFAANKKEFVQQYAVMRHMVAMAEKAKLDQDAMTKQRLAFMRDQVMVQAQMEKASNEIVISAEELKLAYDRDRSRYAAAKVKLIYLPFGSAAPGAAGAKTPMTEAEAKAKADEVVKKARAGADFVKLVKEHSQDPDSAAKDGDFGTLKLTDNLPEPVKTAIFALKKGEVSDPVRQQAGFYVFRVEDAQIRSLDEVRAEVTNGVKQAKFQKWLDSVRQAVSVTFDNEAYFASPAGR